MARERLEVGICGVGPVWEGIEECLRSQQRLRVRWLGNSLAGAAREVLMLSPHAVLFENDKAEPAVVAAILSKLPGTKLIGFNPKGNAITVFSASEQPVLSVEELTRVIEDGRVSRVKEGD
jgi:hypothetical protein